ncbi:MAG: arginine deiminase family protein [Tenuifilaceae bacterium]|jgi:arginine deiminase|nr:arginine deiminase family protein [Tenuifilaceae bacterium]
METKMEVNVRSEIGELEGVILHTPGAEVENMTPQNAQRALYSDILNLAVAKKEYAQLSGVLSKVTRTFQVMDLLTSVLENNHAKDEVVTTICRNENVMYLIDELLELPAKELARQLIEGVPLKRNNLTNFLSHERFSLRPLYNFYFTRDASVSMLDEVLIAPMANRVRDRESLIMEAIFNHSGLVSANTVNPHSFNLNGNVSIEGGDVLIARDDILLIGNGTRTTTQGIDFIISRLMAQQEKKKHHIIVQELPESPESFIHLDMVFTLLDKDQCMVFDPVMLQPNRFQTVQITIENGKVLEIKTVDNMLVALKTLGMDLQPIFCGGTKDEWTQEREQWHSGANFVAIGPGKVIGYARNIHTMEEMSKNGYEIIRAKDVLNNRIDLNSYSKYVVTIDGSELPRGGGGARCMTMPVSRRSVNW